ncbi:MAG: glycosyltransferase family 9 protein [Nannocystaceae bacterium]
MLARARARARGRARCSARPSTISGATSRATPRSITSTTGAAIPSWACSHTRISTRWLRACGCRASPACATAADGATGPWSHPFGSERSKDWRDVAAWRELVGRAAASPGRPVVIVGAPAEREALTAIAQGSFATVMTCPLPEYAELLREAGGLISVDTVAIHLAAAVGCPTVVLRQGPARGHAFVPGPTALCVDALGDAASVEDVLALALRRVLALAGAAERLRGDARARARARGLARRSRLAGVVDAAVAAGARVHSYDEDRDDAGWRELLGAGIGPASRSAADTLARLAEGRSDAGRRRWRALQGGAGPLAIAARRIAAGGSEPGRSAAWPTAP